MPEFVRDNAGKAFEFMVEKVEEERKAAGMSTIEEAFKGENTATASLAIGQRMQKMIAWAVFVLLNTMRTPFRRFPAGRPATVIRRRAEKCRFICPLPPPLSRITLTRICSRCSVRHVNTAKSEPKEMLDAVDPHRKKFGLKTFAELRAEGGGEKENLLIQQKTETVDALSKIAQPCNGVPEVCERSAVLVGSGNRSVVGSSVSLCSSAKCVAIRDRGR